MSATFVFSVLIFAGASSLAVAQQVAECPRPGGMPPPTGNRPEFTDTNVAVYVGGDFTATNSAAEVEGLFVVQGDATIARTPGNFNVGTVGVGSQVAPPPGSDMMIVGGDLTVAGGVRLDVGANAVDESGALAGGNLDVGGTITNNGTIDVNNGAVRNPSDAAAQYAPFGGTIAALSADLAALPGNAGTVSGNQVTFAGDGTTNLQVFTISAADLANVAEFYFTNIAQDADGAYAPVVVNVVGGPVTDLSPNYVAINGVRVDDFTNPNMGNAAAALMWNFADATDVTLGGSSQELGSILVPTAASSVTITASTNGRVYVGGDLTMSGTGNELHNYPWTGAEETACTTEPPEQTATARVTKTITPGSFLDTFTNDNGQLARFHGTVTCPLAGGGLYAEDFTVRGSESFTMEGLPVDATCVVTERLVETDQGTSAAGYTPVDIGEWVWARPVITIDGTVTNEFTTSTDTVPAISLTNMLVGRTDVTKRVVGAETTQSYEVTWQATNPAGDAQDGYVVAAGDTVADPAAGTSSGTLTLTDGQTLAPVDATGNQLYFPAGTNITFDESTPDDIPGHTFDGVTFDPSPATIGPDAAHVSVTATNTYTAKDATFRIRKALTGDGADLVPSDTTFSVSYTVNGVPAETPLTIAADGTEVDGPTLKHGDVVAFTEDPRPDVQDVNWGAVVIDPAELTLDAEAAVPVVAVTNEARPARSELSVVKLDDASGAALAGAIFDLVLDNGDGTYEPDVDEVVSSCTTEAESGSCTIRDLGLGTYFWVEVTPPTGYALPANSVSGPVVIDADNAGTGIAPTTVRDARLPTTMAVRKVDADTEQPLTGAAFDVYLDDGDGVGSTPDDGDEKVGECTTDGTGSCAVTDLDFGAYYWAETTAPEGYALPDDRTSDLIVIDADNAGRTHMITIANTKLPSVPSEPTPAEPAPGAADGEEAPLPDTGAHVGHAVAAGILLLTVGAALIVGGTRKRSAR